MGVPNRGKFGFLTPVSEKFRLPPKEEPSFKGETKVFVGGPQGFCSKGENSLLGGEKTVFFPPLVAGEMGGPFFPLLGGSLRGAAEGFLKTGVGEQEAFFKYFWETPIRG